MILSQNRERVVRVTDKLSIESLDKMMSEGGRCRGLYSYKCITSNVERMKHDGFHIVGCLSD